VREIRRLLAQESSLSRAWRTSTADAFLCLSSPHLEAKSVAATWAADDCAMWKRYPHSNIRYG